MRKISDQQAAGSDKLPVQTKKITVRIALIAAAIAAVMMFALAANAASGGKLYGAMLLNNDNRHIANEPNYVSMEEVPAGAQTATSERRLLVSNIINENQLQTLLASSITHITTEGTNGNYAIPEVLTDNGDLVIFTKTDELGWHLNKGEQLTIQFPLDLKTRSKYSDQTEKGWRSAILKTVR